MRLEHRGASRRELDLIEEAKGKSEAVAGFELSAADRALDTAGKLPSARRSRPPRTSAAARSGSSSRSRPRWRSRWPGRGPQARRGLPVRRVREIATLIGEMQAETGAVVEAVGEAAQRTDESVASVGVTREAFERCPRPGRACG